MAVTFLTQFSTDIFNNHKFLTTWLILVNLYVGFAVVRLWGAAMAVRGRSIPRLPRRLATAGLLLVIVTGGTIDLMPILRNDPPQSLAMDGDRLYDWVRQETDPRSVFLSDIYIQHPILLAAAAGSSTDGRPIPCRWDTTWHREKRTYRNLLDEPQPPGYRARSAGREDRLRDDR